MPRTASFRVWGSSFPQLAIGPNGELYIAYAAYPDDERMDSGDAFMVSSLDGGQTWTLPITVNDDDTKRLQFYLSIAVDPEGILHMMWGIPGMTPPSLPTISTIPPLKTMGRPGSLTAGSATSLPTPTMPSLMADSLETTSLCKLLAKMFIWFGQIADSER